MKSIDYTEGEREITNCEFTTSITLYMAPNRAEEFVTEINLFLKELRGRGSAY
ncbi:hypothetical protein JM83_1794 [Gillisia sp. Hel_I_86]|uniref:hypothetical protein n=1 Tax=Gillisia sp. Hel_I_86 TaxID=1249981 RepID=UPI00119A67ED|nr:hypothetical protein [Gillisia sp. Hel_I_86]TVZ26804.1 hypothetical protein JM83_1794 [Gillisia sp. Hel_I_86]